MPTEIKIVDRRKANVTNVALGLRIETTDTQGNPVVIYLDADLAAEWGLAWSKAFDEAMLHARTTPALKLADNDWKVTYRLDNRQRCETITASSIAEARQLFERVHPTLTILTIEKISY